MNNTHKFEYSGYRVIAFKDVKFSNIWDYEIFRSGQIIKRHHITCLGDKVEEQKEKLEKLINHQIDNVITEDEIELLRSWAKKADYND